MRYAKQQIALSIENLGLRRQGRWLCRHDAVTLHEGDMLLLYGPNGSGKTTVLRSLATLFTPTEGGIYWCAESIYDAHVMYREQVFYLGHNNGIRWGLTVHENICLAAQLPVFLPQMDYHTVLTQLGLIDHEHRLTGTLSAGQKRRVALAKLFISAKLVWILDEPCTALDQTGQTVLFDRLATHLRGGGIAILSSHQRLNLREDIKVRNWQLQQIG